MQEPTRLNLNIGVPGDKPKQKSMYIKARLSDVIAWIKAKGHDEYITNALIKIASSFPDGAYGTFRKSYHKYLSRIQEERKKND
jgi:hypothetical protein